MKELNKNNPFKIPEGYFENLSKGVMKKLAVKDVNIPKSKGFVVPDTYFEKVHDTILQKLEAEEVKVIRLRPLKKLYLAVASIAAIFLVVIFFNQNTSTEITFEDLANSDIENYFEDYSLDFSTYEIAEVIPVDELEIGDILSNGLNEEMILNYLDNNTENFEELNMEYDE